MFRYRLVRAMMIVVQTILASKKVTGRQNIPPGGPYIAVVNHMSVADTPLLLVAFPPLKWRFFAAEKWQAHWFYGPIMGWLGAVYIKRGEVDRRALQEALAALKAGSVFGLAPEGTRSKEQAMTKAKDGAAYLASRADVLVLPVGLINTDQLFANARRLRRTHLEIRIGRPFMLPDLGHRPKGAELSAYTHLIMVHIAALLPPRYHGYYQDSPALQALLAGQDPWPHCLAAEGAKSESRIRRMKG
jgi:1-acyl-sn-glycerol-3-phosphate acyltransferase